MKLFLQVCFTEVWIIYVSCYETYSFPRSYILHTEGTTWYKSQEICKESGGHLATLYDYSTVPDLDIRQYFHSNYRMFWIGLYYDNNTEVFQWTNGDSITWSNWRVDDTNKYESINTTSLCVMATVEAPYDWVATNCSENHYFLCQHAGGECRFVRYQDAFITSHDYMHLYQQTADDCKQTCAVQLSGTCKSFEHFPVDGRCQFSAENRWTLSEYYRSAPGWVYYHRTCNTGGVNNVTPIVSTMNVTAASCFQTTSIYLTPDVQSVTVTVPQSVFITRQEYITSKIYVTKLVTSTKTIVETTTQVLFLTPSYPSLTESSDNKPMEELQEIGIIAKEKQKTLKKISMDDKRPSAKYVGYVAVAFLSAVFGSLVLFDLITLFRNKPSCCLKTKQFKKPRSSVHDRMKNPLKVTKGTKLEEDRINMQEHVPSVSNLPQTSKLGEFRFQTDVNKTKTIHHKAQMHWRPLVWAVTDSGIDGSELSNSPSPSETSSWYYNDIDTKGDNSETSGEFGTISKQNYTTHF